MESDLCWKSSECPSFQRGDFFLVTIHFIWVHFNFLHASSDSTFIKQYQYSFPDASLGMSLWWCAHCLPNLPSRQFESVASRVSHVTLQTVRVWGSLELDTLLNILLILEVASVSQQVASHRGCARITWSIYYAHALRASLYSRQWDAIKFC